MADTRRSWGRLASVLSLRHPRHLGRALVLLLCLLLVCVVPVLRGAAGRVFFSAGAPRRGTRSSNGGGSAPLPDWSSLPVFLINGPEDYAARKWAEQQLASIGVSRYERINGVMVEADDCQRLSGTGCQQGLALAHFEAWTRIAQRRLPGALVVEDDVTFHAQFGALLPRYWARVPGDWQFVWLGHVGRDGGAVAPHALTLAHGLAPWMLHAYLVTWDAAEMLARMYDFLLQRTGSPHAKGVYPAQFATQQAIQDLPLHLSFRELKSDYFVPLAVHFFLRPGDRAKWIALQSTPEVPARLGAWSWHDARAIQLGKLSKTACMCELWGNETMCSREETETRLPVGGTGLAYQNLCRYRRWALHTWLGQPHLAKAPTCAQLRAVISPDPARSDPTPHDCVDDVWPFMPVGTTPKETVGGGDVK